jgi:hypothetical protein
MVLLRNVLLAQVEANARVTPPPPRDDLSQNVTAGHGQDGEARPTTNQDAAAILRGMKTQLEQAGLATRYSDALGVGAAALERESHGIRMMPSMIREQARMILKDEIEQLKRERDEARDVVSRNVTGGHGP